MIFKFNFYISSKILKLELGLIFRDFYCFFLFEFAHENVYEHSGLIKEVVFKAFKAVAFLLKSTTNI